MSEENEYDHHQNTLEHSIAMEMDIDSNQHQIHMNSVFVHFLDRVFVHHN